MKKSLFAIAALIIVSVPALAAGDTVVPVPEPGVFGLLAMSTIALVIAARYKRRK